MELTEGIKHIIDGNAVIIMGAGASYGAKNSFGEFPSGTALAKKLYTKCDILPDDENDLQDAAQCFEEKYSAIELITEIRSLLTCASFSESHEIIYTLPWMRYYTTNYDDVPLLAAKKHGISLTPVTLSSPLKNSISNERLCVHINGHIGNLNERTLHTEFKLTAESYLSQINILNSEWGQLLINDLETAKCIVILGLSLRYDLDLNKLIYNTNIINKTIIIDSPYITANSENRLKRFGSVYKIGIDGFADKISEIQSSYISSPKLPTERLYSAFTYEYKKRYRFSLPTPEDIFRLFFNGQYSDSLYYKIKGQYCGLIYRTKFTQIKDEILSGKQFVFIHADMGNGKTACINELRYRLSRENIHIFTLTDSDSSNINEEIAAICSLSRSEKVLVIIDDYSNYMELLHVFTLLENDNIQFVLTARSALNYNKLPTVLEMFHVTENKSTMFDINMLDRVDIENCATIFEKHGLFGKNANLSREEKIAYYKRANPQNAKGSPRARCPVQGMKNKTGENSNDQQPVNRQSRAYHKCLHAKPLLIIPEHDFNLPAMRVMFQNFFIGQPCIRTQKCA